MNLLDELAKNSFRSDSVFFELSSSITSLSLQSTLLQNNLSTPEDKRQKVQNKVTFISDLISKQKNETLGSGGTAGQEYIERYRDKVTKISTMVSLLSAKNRKIQYQFMIHLERWVKSNKTGTEITKIKESKETPLCSPKKQKKKDCSLVFSDISQLVAFLERKVREAIRCGFTKVNQRFKFVLKIEFLGSFLENLEAKYQREKVRWALELVKNLPKKLQIQQLNIKIAKSLKIPLQLKALSIKNLTDSSPLPSIAFTHSSQHPKLPFQYPQNSPTQNIDYYDTLTIFMNDDPKSQEKVSQFDLSFSNNVCLSVFDADKETLSQKSFIKQLSDVELTTAPVSAFAKRKISDFTISDAENRIMQNFSHVAEKKSNQTGLNLIKSEVNFHNSYNENPLQRYFEPEEREFLSPRTHDFSIFSKVELQASEPAKRYSLQRQLIPRSGSEAKASHRPCFSNVKEGIEREYEEEMDKYKTFKKYLQKRRESTMKQIENNQQILKKLMQKFEKSKQKAQKLKISLKPKCENDKMAISLQKRSFLNSKSPTPSGTSHKDQSSRSAAKKGNDSLTKQDGPIERTLHSLQKGERKLVNFNDYPKNMDIYYNYVRQKKIMDSSKVTPKKFSPSQKCNSLSSSKKQSKTSISSVAQKNLLVISKFPCQKEQRVDLRVDLSKPQSKKTSRHPQKQKLKIAQVKVFHPKAKNQLK